MNTFKTQIVLATLAYSALSINLQAQQRDGKARYFNRAQLGETCEGHNESTGNPFPYCEFGLTCVDNGEVTIPGEEKHCVDASPQPLAGLGETCEGFNESTGMPFPSCDKGLMCSWRALGMDEVTIPGAEKKCYLDHKYTVPTQYETDQNGNLWERYFDLDLYGKGDVKQIYDWEKKGYTMDDLQQIVVENDWNSVTLRWGTAFFKKVDGQITRDDLGYELGAEMWNLVPTDDQQWVQYTDLDLYGKGDIKQIYNYEAQGYTIEDLQQIVIDHDWSSVTTRWGTAFFKKVDGKITKDDLSNQNGAKMWVYRHRDF